MAKGGDIRADIKADIAARTDSYFTRTRKILERFGDKQVTYAIFLRRPVICAPRMMADWIEAAAGERGTFYNYQHPDSLVTPCPLPTPFAS